VDNRATGLSSPDVLIDFGSELFPYGTAITTEFAGVTFGSIGSNYTYATTLNLGPSLSFGFLGPGDNSIQLGPIFFTSDVTDAVFSWGTNVGSTSFAAYLVD